MRVAADNWRRGHFSADDGGHTGRRLDRTQRREHLVLGRDDFDCGGGQVADEPIFFTAGAQLGGGDDEQLEHRAGGVRVAYEVRTIEEHALAGRIGVVGQCTERADDRILAAGNGLHARWLCYSRFQMKERILKRFNDEIAALERELKVDLPKEIQRARELGDLRENAEYKAAKERQEIVNARIAMLKKRVGEISLLNLDRIPHDRAGFGSTVHLRDGNGDTIIYQLVTPEESDFDKGMISTSSPIGRAILNKEEGDAVKVTTPNGVRTFELIKVLTIHDEE